MVGWVTFIFSLSYTLATYYLERGIPTGVEALAGQR